MTGPVVLVPLNGSRRALAALPIARRLAELRKVPVRILHVTEAAGPLGKTAVTLGLAPADLRGATLEVRAGSPADAILAAAGDCRARVIVMCASTAKAGAGDAGPADASGATALAVIKAAACPVVLVDPARPPGGWALKRALASHDGSPSISAALAPAAELARAAGAELIVLHVADDARDRETAAFAAPVYMDQLHHGWPAWSGEFLQRLACVCPLADVPVRLLVARGDPATETIRVAGEVAADLVVLAWRGGWEARHDASLTALLRSAPCPVMVTRAPAA
ncbi:MAG TPA: universal stress protein [Caulobacteraceae bacterium]|nr:universal stress protein [Caulobacteraceae bacterium]